MRNVCKQTTSQVICSLFLCVFAPLRLVLSQLLHNLISFTVPPNDGCLETAIFCRYLRILARK